MRVVDLREVVIFGRQNRFGVEQLVEVDRVGEVLAEGQPPGLRFVGEVADGGVVLGVSHDLLGRFEADFVEYARVVVHEFLVGSARTAPDGHRRTGHARLLRQFLGLGQVRAYARFAVGARTRGMAGHTHRQEETGGIEHPRVQALEGPTVDRVVDRFAYQWTAERLGFDVEEEILARDGRLLGIPIRGLAFHLGQQGRGGRVVVVEYIGTVVEHLLGLALVVGNDPHVHVYVSGRNTGDRGA